MRRYEHKVRVIHDHEWSADFDKLAAVLNEEGAVGWCLSHLQAIPGFRNAFLCILTRVCD